MEMAGNIVDAAQRAAKLREAQGMAAEAVEEANAAANDAAVVRIEAQAGAGRVLREMLERGERRADGRYPDPNRGDLPTVRDLMGDKSEATARKRAARWRKVASIPDNIRAEYVDEMKEKRGEITTAGLLRHANSPTEPKDPTSVEEVYTTVMRLSAQILNWDPHIMAGHAAATKGQQGKFVKRLKALRKWCDEGVNVFVRYEPPQSE